LLVHDRVRDEISRGGILAIGIDALHHMPLARELLKMPEVQAAEVGSLVFFIDIHLYTANHFALAQFSSLLPGIAFAYHYLEADDDNRLEVSTNAGNGLPFLAPVDGKDSASRRFAPPLFLSAGCYLKHHVSKGICPKPCAKQWHAILSDRERRYRVIVDDCVTMLFRPTSQE
jgi:hypothetical protein